jgi:hypothetical protein
MDSETGNTILTNGVVLAITGFVIVALGSGLIGCIIWIFNRVMKEIKSYREESLAQSTELTNALNNKFKSLNYYTKLTDKIQIQHEERLNVFHDHAREVKSKLFEHQQILSKHDIEISNLKKVG